MHELNSTKKVNVGNVDIEFSMSSEFLSLVCKELGLADASQVDDVALKTVFTRILSNALNKLD